MSMTTVNNAMTNNNTMNKTSAVVTVDNTTIADKYIDVLGTQYTIRHVKNGTDKFMEERNFCGYCDKVRKLIIIDDLNTDSTYDEYTIPEKAEMMKCTLRHEVIHAFLKESGLDHCSHAPVAWATSEEMVDWFAHQMPKIYSVYQEIGCI